MANRIKMQLSTQMSKYFGKTIPHSHLNIRREPKTGNIGLNFPIDPKMTQNLERFSKDSQNEFGIENISVRQNKTALVSFNREFFMENIAEGILNNEMLPNESKKIIVEFSSPNIAKPFHVGHLRSTITGNFIANILEYCGNNVIRLNYLGDWGTQFGMLKIGIDKTHHLNLDIKNNPIKSLYEAYVFANKLAKNDISIAIRARQIFNQIEKGELKDLDDWKKYKDYTVNELSKVYGRLGIKFDDYHWESSYHAKILEPIIEDLQNKDILTVDVEGKKVAFSDSANPAVVVKSDGSSLYLGRDIGAALDRYEKYNFDEMIYVTDSSQAGHFKNLLNIMTKANYPVASKCRHVGFGRIHGMSTRKGDAVFLKDILNEAKKRMRKKQELLKTTKTNLGDDYRTADILGTSSIIISDLRRSRMKNYEFSWDSLLDSSSGGIRLQYVHCRLYSIEKNCNVDIPSKLIPQFLREPEAIELIEELSLFEDTVMLAKEKFEAAILVSYLFKLISVVNVAVDRLRVKDESKERAEQRLLLFHCARLTLKKGLKILGLNVLNEM